MAPGIHCLPRQARSYIISRSTDEPVQAASWRCLEARHSESGSLRGVRSVLLAPKHTVGEQLLDVRRDKRERAAYAAAGTREPDDDEDGEEG